MRSHRLTPTYDNTPGKLTVGDPENDPPIDTESYDPEVIGRNPANTMQRPAYVDTTRDANYIPWRGGEQHGIAYTEPDAHPGNLDSPHTMVHLANDPPTVTGKRDKDDAEPILVRQWDSGERTEIHGECYNLPLVATDAGIAKQLVGHNSNRKKLHVVNKPVGAGGTADRIYIGFDNNVNTVTGFIMDSGDSIDFDGTSPIFVLLPAYNGGAILNVWAEYDVTYEA